MGVYGQAIMRDFFEEISRLPWFFVIAFNVAALTAFLLMLALNLLVPQGQQAASIANVEGISEKRIAFSIDDAPRGAGAFLDVKERPRLLLAALEEGGIKQAVFYSNPGRFSVGSEHEKAVQNYAKAGHVLANHTANHLMLSKTSAAAFLADIDKAEAWLIKQNGYRPWLRFPHLDEGGKDLAKRDAVRAGMKARGLTHGYVTVDASDWFLEGRTITAQKSGKVMNCEALRELYVETHLDSANFSHRLAKRTLGRAPVQMLLLHETDLAAMFVDDLAKALRADGWQIVSADTAYKDAMAAMMPDTEYANGNMLQMLAWERGIDGSRWFKGNDTNHMAQVFQRRVVRN